MGNYYSIMGEHLKAVMYFRKALKLDRSCLAAWTLMGHEYLEMKNIPGAIDAYRQAVEIDPKDFRAWYGLGQTYELQNMNHYALYYFSRAVESKSRDARMWSAMASCYDRMDKKVETKKCLERAENCKDREGIALHKLGRLYSLLGNQAKAIEAFTENLRRKDELRVIDKELSECLIFLARHYKETNCLEQALLFARRLYDFQGHEREEASSLLHEINTLMCEK
jgi:anaphase-promoting complex subunit 8